MYVATGLGGSSISIMLSPALPPPEKAEGESLDLDTVSGSANGFTSQSSAQLFPPHPGRLKGSLASGGGVNNSGYFALTSNGEKSRQSLSGPASALAIKRPPCVSCA